MNNYLKDSQLGILPIGVSKSNLFDAFVKWFDYLACKQNKRSFNFLALLTRWFKYEILIFSRYEIVNIALGIVFDDSEVGPGNINHWMELFKYFYFIIVLNLKS